MVRITEHDESASAAEEGASARRDGDDAAPRGGGSSGASAGASVARPAPASDDLSERSDDAEAHKARGNAAFGEGRWADAERHYTLALEALPAPSPPASDRPPRASGERDENASPDEEKASPADADPDPDPDPESASPTKRGAAPPADRTRAVYHANRAACLLRLGRFADAEVDCDASVRADASFAKAWLRRAAARSARDPPDLEGAVADCERAARLAATAGPGADAAVARRAADELARLRPMAERRREEIKEEMLAKLKDLGNAVLGNFGLSVNNFKAEKDERPGSYNIQFVQNPTKEDAATTRSDV